jgi:hypothetical protein
MARGTSVASVGLKGTADPLDGGFDGGGDRPTGQASPPAPLCNLIFMAWLPVGLDRFRPDFVLLLELSSVNHAVHGVGALEVRNEYSFAPPDEQGAFGFGVGSRYPLKNVKLPTRRWFATTPC